VKRKRGYRVLPFSANRHMAAASAAVSKERDTIHILTEVDVTEPRRLIREHCERTGESLSLTAYIVACLARAVAENPLLNPLASAQRTKRPTARFTTRSALRSGRAMRASAHCPG
jgi:hypothetical protein